MSTEPRSSGSTKALKQAAAEKSLEFIRDGQTVGLGTGSTVRYLLEALAVRMEQGLRITGVPSSKETAAMASALAIPIRPDEESWDIDVAIDGADEVDPYFNLIKGGGGALLREKILAANAKQFVVIVDAGKQVPSLGLSFPLPVEVLPFGWPNTARQIERLGYQTRLRRRDGQVFVTDNQNYVLDVHCGTITEPRQLEQRLNSIPGVVENGLFVGMASVLIVGEVEGAIVHRIESAG